MRTILISDFALGVLLLASPIAARAQDTAMTNTDSATTSQTTGTTVATHGYLGHESGSVKPEAGVLEFTDATGGASGRLAAGIGLDSNFVSLVYAEPSTFYFGISTGAVFAHLGDATANFFGSNVDNSIGLSGANTVLIPANLKFGYNISDLLRVSLHGGGNVFYRSIAASMELGPSSATTASSWDIFPNAGLDLELAIAPAAALVFRPDWTFTTGNSVFMGTVGLSVILG